jgi:hypothetical protein
MTGIVGIAPHEIGSAGPNPLGPANGIAARALYSAVAHHFELPFAEVRGFLAPLMPRHIELLQTPNGWTRLAETLPASSSDHGPFRASVQ